ncbi:ABC transporter ATP-binding protein [Luteimonas sp. Y-2-2-4F]|nr:ABC transporter ATP-binding protein [Luteimonas sp. Y-2-2-4F]MCD9033296.1 ABC transporter ATP-binding protein [Luteimonas sp. Y-2-2-4F]
MSASLQIAGIGKSYRVDGSVLPVLRGIDLDVAAGEFVSIVGASGCGKSTLLRLVVGLEGDYSGRIAVAGQPVAGTSLERGIVFQEPRLLPWLTVERNIALGLLNSGLSKADKAEAVRAHIDLVRLNGFERAWPHQLSGGMAQRVALARALVNRPKLLLLDEPFGALDALTRAHMQTELQRLWQQEGITMILVTHDVEEAVYLGNRVVVMRPRPGRIERIVDIGLPFPRDRNGPALLDARRQVVEAFAEALP